MEKPDTSINIEKQKFQMVKSGLKDIANGIDKLRDDNKKSPEIQKIEIVSNNDGDNEWSKNLWEMLRGKPGHTPTDEELLVLIRPLIPEPIAGHSPTDEELMALIRPLIPKVKDGETPSDERLLALIQPLIVLPSTAEVALEASKLVLNELKSLIPKIDTPEELADKLGQVRKAWIPIEAVRGDFSTRVPRPIIVPPNTSGMLTVDEVNALIAAYSGKGSIITATDSGDHQTYTLATPITTPNYYAIINNGMYTPDDPAFPFVATGTVLTFTSPLPDDLSGKLIKIVCV
jgi:hypothetical protein